MTAWWTAALPSSRPRTTCTASAGISRTASRVACSSTMPCTSPRCTSCARCLPRPGPTWRPMAIPPTPGLASWPLPRPLPALASTCCWRPGAAARAPPWRCAMSSTSAGWSGPLTCWAGSATTCCGAPQCRPGNPARTGRKSTPASGLKSPWQRPLPDRAPGRMRTVESRPVPPGVRAMMAPSPNHCRDRPAGGDAMDHLLSLIDFILHIDVHLGELIRNYGPQTSLILFAIVFIETGLVIMPLLPGDSLLFAAGTFAARGDFDLLWLGSLLSVAAIAGDSLNYAIGHWLGPRVFSQNYRWLNRRHLQRTEEFYARHGGKTIVLARFVPIVRTFAPFVAGVGAMNYPRFLFYSIAGGLLWVWGFLLLGYHFGNLPAVQGNFTLVILAIIFISVLPVLVEYLRARRSAV